LRATADLVGAAKESDVMIIIVPTFLDSDNNPDLSIVESVCKNISKGLEKGDFVISECTLPPRTTKEVILPILENSGLNRGEFGLAHCPERTSSGRAIEDITGAYPKVVGGIDKKSTETAEAIYSVINKKGVITTDATTAEAVKVFEGLYRDVNIALANELARVCMELDIDAIEAFEVANTQPYSHIHKPGCGVGGHCIPIYPYFIISPLKTNTELLQVARKINDEMALYTVKLAEDGLEKVGMKLEDSNLLLLGLTYRGGVKETRKSPAIAIINILKNKGAMVFAYDPLLQADVEQFGAKYITLENTKDIDAVIIATDHKEFKVIDWNKLNLRHKILIDGRQIINPKKIIEAGYIYKGIGVNYANRGSA
ncbi:MAG TPA: nucleotide sugar dehydrogenase, partial [Methanosarcinales archaeon]|nr:nucleotide sugar dehydrogenase [Methanosarcinales archaeon]